MILNVNFRVAFIVDIKVDSERYFLFELPAKFTGNQTFKQPIPKLVAIEARVDFQVALQVDDATYWFSVVLPLLGSNFIFIFIFFAKLSSDTWRRRRHSGRCTAANRGTKKHQTTPTKRRPTKETLKDFHRTRQRGGSNVAELYNKYLSQATKDNQNNNNKK